MEHPHWVRVTRGARAADVPGGAAPVTVNPRTGAWTQAPIPGGGPLGSPAGQVLVAEGPADVQDRGRTLVRNEAGVPTQRSDATAFLEESWGRAALDAGAIRDGDVVTVWWRRAGYGPDLSGPSEDARVAKVVRLDTCLELERL